MKKTIALYSLLILKFSSVTLAQETLKISGMVIDAQTKKPLAFATISILGTSQGVVSNFLGGFGLTLPNVYVNDTLQVSMLGYSIYKEVIKNIDTNKKLIISLAESAILLKEVEVKSKQLTAREIVEKVIENIPVNYPTSSFLLEGFTRSSTWECGEYLSLYEATFDLYGRGYTKTRGKPEKIYIKESRQSKKVEHYHSPVLSNNRNLFRSLIHVNDVLLKTHSLKFGRNKYELEKYTMINDQLVYVIKTANPKHAIHRMYIDSDSFALLRVDMEAKTLDGQNPNPSLNYRPSSDSTSFQVTDLKKVLEFEKHEEKYYLKYVNWWAQGTLIKNETKEGFCDWGWQFEMMFDKVIVSDVKKPSKERLLKPVKGKDPKTRPYNSTYWKNYRLIKDFPITKKIVLDLEKEGNLEKQFEKSY